MTTEFTPFSATVGGLLIGCSAAMMLLACGRIAGISGIVGSALAPATPDRAWRLMFLLGLPLGAGLWRLHAGGPAVVDIQAPGWLVVIGGVLVGLGTQLGSGCTSGHGVCGVSRGSPRSIIATLVFMAAGFATVAVTRHWIAA